MEDTLLFKELTYVLRGLLFSVHNELGNFRNEKQYADSLEEKLKENNIQYEREKILLPSFEGEKTGRNRLDFLIDNKLILELKHVVCLSRDDYFQCQRYLVSSNLYLCLLVNFRSKYLVVRRVLNHEKYKKEKSNQQI
jgi:GxxExxY protein